MSNARETGAKPGRRVNAVDNCCAIMDALSRLGGGGIADLDRELDLTKGAIHTQLKTLEDNGYVVQRGDEYHLSLLLLNRGLRLKRELPLYNAASEELARLAQETGENVHLMVEQNGMGYILHKETGEKAAPTTSRVGKELHLHYTSTGKAILAFLPRERVDEIVERHGLPKKTPETIGSRGELERELEEIRRDGVAFDRGEQLSQARCVGCPIIGPADQVLGAISISGPKSRFSGEYFESTLTSLVEDAANSIEMNLEINQLA
jgi:DNA-binding IclR family transcriptional regulator